MEEGYRKDNPARQTRRPKRQPTHVYRLTKSEATAMLLAASSRRERWAIYLAICAGLRNAELRGLQGRHFARPGFVRVSSEIAKGGRERWVPVIADLVPVVAEIRFNVRDDEYVLPAQRFRDPPFNKTRDDLRYRRSSSQALRTLVMDVGLACRDQRRTSIRTFCATPTAITSRGTRACVTHSSCSDTRTSARRRPTSASRPLTSLQAAVEGFTFDAVDRTDVLGVPEGHDSPDKATTGIEPVYTALQAAA